MGDGRKFKYHDCHRPAIETLIYLYEVVKVRRQKALLETFSGRSDLKLLQYDDFARYCIKMATGTGKTKVMSLAIAWQYLNAVAEARDDYAKTFLVIAPNVIVFERLKTDFAGGLIFPTDPVVPDDLRRTFWDLQCYMRGEGQRAGSLGALYLTNIQQMHERDESDDDEPDVMTAMLGPKPPAATQEIEDFLPRIAARGGPVVVLNDEAHHTHDEENVWNKIIRRLHAETPGGLAAQLDFSATPRHTKGQLFSWTVYDYPLKQAIVDNIVKRPLKGVARGIAERPSEMASIRYQAYLAAGVERWKEYRDQLKPLNRKPILFVMMNDTKEADDVGNDLRTKYPEEFAGDRLLVIHTNRSGDVVQKDLDAARKVARDVDGGASPVNCIVSVVMLREGWDVQSVTVIVGLRPFSAKANILPEQTVGRGLRLMFRDRGGPEYVDVIGNRKFIEFVEQLEKEEDIQLDEFEIGKDKVSIVVIEPMAEKADKDIALPQLSQTLERKKTLADEIAALDVTAISCPVFPRNKDDKAAQEFHYEAHDLITLEKLIDRDYVIPTMQTAEEVIGYLARRIAQRLKLPSQFAALVPKGARVPGAEGVRRSRGIEHAGDGERHQRQSRRLLDGGEIHGRPPRSGGPGAGAEARGRPPAAVADEAVPVDAEDAGGEEVHFQSRPLRQRIREGVRALSGVGRGRDALRQAAGEFRFRHRLPGRDGQPAVLRAGFRGGDGRRRLAPDRDEGAGGRERGGQGPGGAAVVRERRPADGQAVVVPQGAAGGIRPVAAGAVRGRGVSGIRRAGGVSPLMEGAIAEPSIRGLTPPARRVAPAAATSPSWSGSKCAPSPAA